MNTGAHRVRSWQTAALICAMTLACLSLAASGDTLQDVYSPPPLSRPLLGTIPLERATSVEESFAGAKKILRLPGGALYVDADMDIDADGSPNARQLDPQFGQLETSFNFPRQTGQARFVNAEVVSYIALPGNNRRASARFFRRMGLEVGDIAAVIFRDRVEFALFADVGDVSKIGEGSIALAQSLGHDPFVVRGGKRIVGRSIPGDVIYIVFPRSRITDLTPMNVIEKVRQKGRQLFTELGGSLLNP